MVRSVSDSTAFPTIDVIDSLLHHTIQSQERRHALASFWCPEAGDVVIEFVLFQLGPRHAGHGRELYSTRNGAFFGTESDTDSRSMLLCVLVRRYVLSLYLDAPHGSCARGAWLMLMAYFVDIFTSSPVALAGPEAAMRLRWCVVVLPRPHDVWHILAWTVYLVSEALMLP